MTQDIQNLKKLNEQINTAENTADMKAFEDILAPMFAFKRADGMTFDDRHAFMEKPKPGARTLEIEAITFYGNRAVVTCVVKMGGTEFHNIRLFVRENAQSAWKLLGWANEAV